MAKPNYVAKRSAWAAITFWRVVLSFLIIPFLIMLVDIFVLKSNVIEFYDDYVIQRSGVLSKKEKRTLFTGVAGVSVNQTFWQRLCNYGDVQIDVFGNWDIDTKNIANPHRLKHYLESKFIKGGAQQIITN